MIELHTNSSPRSCFILSLDAKGNVLLFFKSVRAIRATSSSSSLTIGSLPTNKNCNIINNVPMKGLIKIITKKQVCVSCPCTYM